MKVTVRVNDEIEMYFPSVEKAAVELLRRCGDRFLGQLKRDGLTAIQRERRGVVVRTSQPAKAGE